MPVHRVNRAASTTPATGSMMTVMDEWMRHTVPYALNADVERALERGPPNASMARSLTTVSQEAHRGETPLVMGWTRTAMVGSMSALRLERAHVGSERVKRPGESSVLVDASSIRASQDSGLETTRIAMVSMMTAMVGSMKGSPPR